MTMPSSRAGADRAAKLLLLIGEGKAGPVIAALGEEYAETLAHHVASVNSVDRTESVGILMDFLRSASISSLSAEPVCGGVCSAARMMSAAFGPEKAESIMMKALLGM